ncbi:MAG: hypothetical protein H0U42_00965 [Thermoleophilaceae bacterium]|nr:hypothetical protein [Thermoleophilaceae bacterium]
MKVLLLDIAHDLRSKRLWPVAAVLVIAIIAVPVVLLGGGSDGEVPPPVAAVPAPQSQLSTEVRVSESPEGGSSKLGEFTKHNPFKASSKAGLEDPEEAAGSGNGQPASAGEAPAVQPSPQPQSPAAQEPKAEKAPKASKEDAAATPADTRPVKVDERSGKSKRSTRDPQVVVYKADLAYGEAGKVKRHNGVEPLTIFPRSSRLFQFSGIDGRSRSVFTVLSPGLIADKGEGQCTQVAGRCAVLRLKKGEERVFRNGEGDRFRLRVSAYEPIEFAPADL